MKPAREDYLIKYADKTSFGVELLESASVLTVQAWIDDHLDAGKLLQVRRISLDEFSRDVTHEFREPVDADDREAARADWTHQMEMEGAL